MNLAPDLVDTNLPHLLEIASRVALEGHHRLGTGNAIDLGELTGYQLGDLLVVADAQDRGEIIVAGQLVHLGDPIDRQQGLRDFVDPADVGSNEHDGRHHGQALAS